MEGDLKNDWKHGSYKYPLADSLKPAIEQWKDDRKKSWIRPDVPENIQQIIDDLPENVDGNRPLTIEEIFEIVEEFAEAVKIASQNLGKSEALKKFGGQITYFYEYDDLYKYAEENLEAYLAENAIERTRQAANRLMSLEMQLSVIENLNLNKAVVDFLKLVTRCYTWGFDTECMVLCRSAMENALKDRVSIEMCEKHLGKKRYGKYYELADRIEAARKENLIDDKINKMAHGLRIRCKKVVHDDPNLTEKVKETIFETVRVIAVLTSGTDPFGSPDWLKKPTAAGQ